MLLADESGNEIEELVGDADQLAEHPVARNQQDERHTGQTLPKGREAEEIDRRRRPPEGWRVIGTRESAQRDR